MSNLDGFDLEPAVIDVPGSVLEDLHTRLALTRAPLDEGNEELVLRRSGRLSG